MAIRPLTFSSVMICSFFKILKTNIRHNEIKQQLFILVNLLNKNYRYTDDQKAYNFSMSSDFVEWINKQNKKRGWNNSELARQSGLAPSTVSMALGGQTKPGLDFCVGVSRAYGLPPEKVLRQAGLLPLIPDVEDYEIQRLIDLARSMPEAERKLLLEYAEWRYKKSLEADQGTGPAG